MLKCKVCKKEFKNYINPRTGRPCAEDSIPKCKVCGCDTCMTCSNKYGTWGGYRKPSYFCKKCYVVKALKEYKNSIKQIRRICKENDYKLELSADKYNNLLEQQKYERIKNMGYVFNVNIFNI